MSKVTPNKPSRRDDIMNAALGCITELGYAETTIEDIRARSGASVGSIYHHFGIKEGIALAVYLRAISEYQRSLLDTLEAAKEARGGITAAVRHHITWVQNNRDQALYLDRMRHAEFMAGADAELGRLNDEFRERLGGWLGPMFASGAIRQMAPDLMLALLLGPVLEYTRLWLAGRASTPPQKAAKELADAAWQSIGA